MNRGKQPTNVAASVRSRLQNLSRKRGAEFQLVLSDFAIERLLYRLGVSPHADQFVLKGAMLFKLWTREAHRATWDLDLLGRGANRVPEVVAVIRELCSIAAEDGIVFDTGSISGEEMRAEEEYVGVRVRLQAHLAGARIPMQIDVGFGDAITPAALRQTYPTLLDHPPPTILAYPREAVVAEKLEALISLGVTNSRMKDFYDLHVLASSFAFEGSVLAKAVRATFERRGTPFPDAEPLVLTCEFLGAPARQTLWRALLRRARLAAPPDTAELADGLMRFLAPVLAAAAREQPFPATWSPAGPWKSTEEHTA